MASDYLYYTIIHANAGGGSEMLLAYAQLAERHQGDDHRPLNDFFR